MTGLIVVALAVAATAVVAVVVRVVNGRFRSRSAGEALSAPELGLSTLGRRATLVQFSSAFCSPCRATRALLTDVTAGLADVAYVEIDAESHLDLVRQLNVMRTPTVLVLAADGSIVGRASGQPRRDQIEAVLAAV